MECNSNSWKVIAGMQGISGFPAGQYRNELERNSEGLLRVHVEDVDWLDYVDKEGQIAYEAKEINRYDPISADEAKQLAWDWIDVDLGTLTSQ